MSDRISVTGMVLSASPVGEYDKRLVLLTAERGKITAFAKGARQPNSPFIAATRPFAFGTAELYEGRSSYNLIRMQPKRLFEELAMDLEAVCYGSYFCELADYYGHEGIDGRELINLLYAGLTALGRADRDRELIRAVFELRTMASQGEYSETPYLPCGEAASYAWNYCLTSPVGKLFSFRLTPEARSEFIRAVDALKRYYIDRTFRSLEVLGSL